MAADFKEQLQELLVETFEGPQGQFGSFLDGQGGVLQTLAQITPEMASKPVAPGRPPLVAFAKHLEEALTGFNGRAQGKSWEDLGLDYAAPWKLERISPEEWKALQKRVRLEYEEARRQLEAGEFPLAALAHTILHLGGIRAMWRDLQARDGA